MTPPPSTNPSERRAYPRYPYQAAMAFIYEGQSYGGSCHDISLGGVSFISAMDIPVGAGLKLSLTVARGPAQMALALEGTVRWKAPAAANISRYGLAFSPLDTGQAQQLTAILKEIA